jgi:AraC-like DNA-binding protein
LKHISSDELTNQVLDAENIFGKSLDIVNEQLRSACNRQEMIAVVERFLIKLILTSKGKCHPVDGISRMMTWEKEFFSLDKFIKTACLSHKQFDRKFKERVGIPPKQFLEIVRFHNAFRMKNLYPHKDWLTIALHSGYHDY